MSYVTRSVHLVLSLSLVACSARPAAVESATPRFDTRRAVRIGTIATPSVSGVPDGWRVRLGPNRLEPGTRPLLVVDGRVIGRLPVLEAPNDLRADSSAAGRWVATMRPSEIVSLSILKRNLAVGSYGDDGRDGALVVETTRRAPATEP